MSRHGVWIDGGVNVRIGPLEGSAGRNAGWLRLGGRGFRWSRNAPLFSERSANWPTLHLGA